MCAGVSVNGYMDLHVSVQYLRSCMCRCLMTHVSMHVTLYLWILCIYKCTCACPYVTHVQVSFTCVELVYLVCAEPWWSRKAKSLCRAAAARGCAGAPVCRDP